MTTPPAIMAKPLSPAIEIVFPFYLPVPEEDLAFNAVEHVKRLQKSQKSALASKTVLSLYVLGRPVGLN